MTHFVIEIFHSFSSLSSHDIFMKMESRQSFAGAVAYCHNDIYDKGRSMSQGWTYINIYQHFFLCFFMFALLNDDKTRFFPHHHVLFSLWAFLYTYIYILNCLYYVHEISIISVLSLCFLLSFFRWKQQFLALLP